MHLYSSSSDTALVQSSHLPREKELALYRTRRSRHWCMTVTQHMILHHHYIKEVHNMPEFTPAALTEHTQWTPSSSLAAWAPGGRQVCLCVLACLWLINNYSLGPRGPTVSVLQACNNTNVEYKVSNQD